MAEIFEIHITGNEKIIDAAKPLNLKTITLDLLKPDKSWLRTEYMTSQEHRCDSYDACKKYVDEVVEKLVNAGVEIHRVKIECPLYAKYREQSLYCEIHYRSDWNKFPLSKNRGKDYCLLTAREYDKAKYDKLWIDHISCKWREPPDCVTELCLYDSNVNEDKDWFDLYV